jgi:hypothetical protein
MNLECITLPYVKQDIFFYSTLYLNYKDHKKTPLSFTTEKGTRI